MKAIIRAQLAVSLDPSLVDELLDAHQEVKRNLYLGGARLAEVEGGRFCEAAFRLLQQITTGTSTSLGKQLDTQKLINQLESATSHNDSVRMHIPRCLRMVYDVRNKRDAAHLADAIDPNVQDSTLVAGAVDWVLAEFIRLYHNVPANEAHRIVEDIVSRKAPVVQEFEGFLKVLRTDLQAGHFILVLLYQRGPQGAEFGELMQWARPQMLPNLKRSLARLEDELAFVHRNGERYFITRTGQREVESKRLLEGEF